MKIPFSLQSIFPPGTFRKPGVLVIILSACFTFWFVDFWRPYNVTIEYSNNFSWDVLNYYSYLPATFCNNGSFDMPDPVGTGYMPIGPNGHHLPKATYGMALMYSPFFAIAYKIAFNQHSPLNGVSEPFTTCLHWGSIFYCLLGLVFLRKFLLAYFNEKVIALTLLCVFFGTMLFFYTNVQAESTHGYLFMLISLFLLLTQLWHREYKIKYMIGIACVTGIVCLIRPTEVLIFVFFLMWDIRKFSDFKVKFQLFLKHYRQVLLVPVIGFLIWLPQFLFWKAQTGHYFYFSYPGERFFWGDPQIINILFSYRKGWLVYTPMVLLSFIGFFFVKKEFPLSKWTLFLFTAGTVYLLSCWWDWTFGGCFGARGFCQHISFLAIPMAFLFDFVFYSPKQYWFKGLVTLATVIYSFLCIYQNIGQSYQYRQNLIHYHAMTKKVFWDIFRTYRFPLGEYPVDFWNNLKEPDFDKMRNGDRDQ